MSSATASSRPTTSAANNGSQSSLKEWPKSKSDDFPLPPGWQRAVSSAHGGKPYFVNHVTKETSWIDPRDHLWKKKKWEDCGPNELPLGWEVAQDPVCGRYFIDHLNRKNLLDDPRSKLPQQQMAEVKSIVTEQDSVISTKQKTLRVKAANLEKLQKEIAKSADKKKPVDEQKQQEAEVLAKEVETLKTDIDDTTTKLAEIKEVMTTLEKDKTDQLTRQKEVQQEIEQVKQELSQQRELNEKLTTRLEAMHQHYEKNPENIKVLTLHLKETMQVVNASPTEIATLPSEPDLPGLASEPSLPSLKPKPTAEALEAIKVKKQKMEVQQSAKLTGGQQPVITRIEREVELLALKKKLQMEKEQNENLKRIAEAAQTEIQRAMEMAQSGQSDARHKKPQWVQLMNDYASQSTEVRKQARERAQQAIDAGEVMSFRDKLLFFTSAPLTSEKSRK